MNPIDFGGQRSKVKVTMDIYRNKLVNTIETKSRPFRRQLTNLVLNVSFWSELEHKMAFVYARKDDVAVTSF